MHPPAENVLLEPGIAVASGGVLFKAMVVEAEGVGFEPTDRRNLSTVFKTVPINHSGTPPKAQTIDR